MTEMDEDTERRCRRQIRVVLISVVIAVICNILLTSLLPFIVEAKVKSYRREKAADYRKDLHLGLDFISIPYDNQTHTVPTFSVKNLEKCLGY